MKTAPAAKGPATIGDAAFARISALAKEEAGLVLPTSKMTMVQSRLRSRLAAIGLQTYDDYIKFVESQEGVAERRMMISSLTTNVSHFFRENHHFETLRSSLPSLLARAKAGQPIRIWSAGCSSGQEPYSIAMTLLDFAQDFGALDVLILASDIDSRILEKAEAGTYSGQQIGGIPDGFRTKFMSQKGDDLFAVSPNIRRMIRFRNLNLLHEWPMRTQFDVIFCRNVVIYFDTQTQDKLWPRFQNALKPGGILFLGHSERISETTQTRFTSIGMTAYQKAESSQTSTVA